MRKTLSPAFGKLTFRFTPKRVYSRFESRKWDCTPLRIAWTNRSSVFIVRGRGSAESGQLLEFTSPNEYWVSCGKGIEWFRRCRDA
jgi:hypothetical protein